jgi:hypothetical protein
MAAGSVGSGPAADRRRYHRARIPGLVGTLHSPGDVEVLDLSVGGLAFEAAQELSPGDRCFLELHHETSSASVEIEICWSSVRRVERTRGTLKPVFRAGGVFRDIQHDRPGGVLDWILIDPSQSALPELA